MDNSSNWYIYVLFRPWNGVPCYVGQGKGFRWSWHNSRGVNHPNKHLASIIRKAGGPIPVVKVREGLTKEQADEVERALISVLGRAPDGILANMTDGGDGNPGRPHTEESKSKIGAATRGRKLTDAQKKRVSEVHKGKKLSPEQCALLSRVHTGRKHTPEEIEKRAAKLRGRVKTPEHCAAISAAKKGIPISEARKKALREGLAKWQETAEAKAQFVERGKIAFKGKRHTDATKAKISAAHKGVPISEEHKSALREGHKQWRESPEGKAVASERGKVNFLGKKHTEESKAKMKAYWAARRAEKEKEPR